MKRKILLTGARSYVTLDLARQLEASGCEIYVAETSPVHVCRFSNTVTKSFTVPSPRFNRVAFITELVKIVRENKIDMLIPTWEEIFYISQTLDQFPKECTVLSESFEKLETLHNKWKFVNLLQSLGFASPKTQLLSNMHDLETLPFDHPYILKACYCRASQQVHVVIPPNSPPQVPIEPHNPWIAQELLHGKKFCTYSIMHNGEVKATSTYPVEYAIDGNSCLTFKPIHHPQINEWISKLAKAINFTGQAGFDFIQKSDGTLYAIECNPRATSGAHLFAPENNLAAAFFNLNKNPIYPTRTSRKEIAVGMLMYGWKEQPSFKVTWKGFIQTLLTSKDVIFSRKDPLPFILTPFISFLYWRTSKLLKKPLPAMFTHDLEWNNEEQHLENFYTPQFVHEQRIQELTETSS
jgi:predicted ATP-grasp superfamily ATP-dependent carboligase